MINHIKGSILDATEDVICHQVNCQNVMGAGLAKVLYTRWPKVKSAYHSFCSGRKPIELLGSLQLVDVEEGKQVANVFGQLTYGRDKNAVYTDYNALVSAFTLLKDNCQGKSIAIPYGFGCGLANGSWDVVYATLFTILRDMDVTIYEL